MDERVREAFGAVKAGDALKNRTKSYLAREIAKREKRRAPAVRRLAPVFACLVVLLLGFAGYQLAFVPVAAIRVEINPAVELGVNRFGRVVSSEGLNEDGEALAQEENVWFLPYEEALGRLMENSLVADCLARGDTLSIGVVSDDEDEAGALLAGVESCTAGRRGVACCAVDGEEAGHAAAAGLSLAKYGVYEQIRALDPSFTAEEVASLTMRELTERLAALSGGTAENGAGNPASGAGGHHGAGNGTGSGNTGTGNENAGTENGNTGAGNGNTGTGSGNAGAGNGNTGAGNGNAGTGSGNAGAGNGAAGAGTGHHGAGTGSGAHRGQ